MRIGWDSCAAAADDLVEQQRRIARAIAMLDGKIAHYSRPVRPQN